MSREPWRYKPPCPLSNPKSAFVPPSAYRVGQARSGGLARDQGDHHPSFSPEWAPFISHYEPNFSPSCLGFHSYLSSLLADLGFLFLSQYQANTITLVFSALQRIHTQPSHSFNTTKQTNSKWLRQSSQLRLSSPSSPVRSTQIQPLPTPIQLQLRPSRRTLRSRRTRAFPYVNRKDFDFV